MLPRQSKLTSQIALLLLLSSSHIALANDYEAEFQTNDSTVTVSDTWASSATVSYTDFVTKVRTGEYEKIGTLLGAMMESYAESQGDLESAQQSFPVGASSIIVSEETGDVLVQIMFKNQFSQMTDNQTTLNGRNSIPEGMEAQGFQVMHCVHNVCEGYLGLDNLMEISSFPEVLSISPVFKPFTNTGSVTSEGDPAMNTDIARSTYNITGVRKSFGVLSDSFNCDKKASTDYFADIASGDLPSGVTLLSEYFGAGCSDEGRAMMQLIYDVAPGANLGYHTAFNGVLDFAQGIKDLAQAGCSILVDDVVYTKQPFFQDGPIAQAVDTVVSMGTPYFSSAANYARNSWHTDKGFVNSTILLLGNPMHDFDPSTTGVDTVQDINLAEGVIYTIELQWDEPFYSASGLVGSASNVDLFLVNQGNQVLTSSIDNNLGKDATETIQWKATYSGRHGIAITLVKGPPPKYMKWHAYSPQIPAVQYNVLSSTIFGHQNAVGAASVGAAYFQDTPRFGVTPAMQEPYSSAGGTPIFFNKLGQRLAVPEDRKKPMFTGPDGGLTTFFGEKNRFFGTSASAPHVAAIAALMLELNPSLTPNQIYQILQNTALDMDDSATPGFDVGYDTGTGFGFVNGKAALDYVFANRPPTPPPTPLPTSAPTSDGLLCFSETSTVVVLGKGTTEMRNVRVGDRILTGTSHTGQESFELVYAFAHRDETRVAEFLEIHTTDSVTGEHFAPLDITEGHLLWVNGTFQPAKLINVGDVLQGQGGNHRVVTMIKRKQQLGLYAPLTTPSGTLLVNGIKVSSYVSIQKGMPGDVELKLPGIRSGMSQHQVVHLFLSPIRILCLGGGIYVPKFCGIESIDKNSGHAPFVSVGLDIATFCDEQSMHVQLFLYLIFVIFFGALYLTELLVGPSNVLMVVALGAVGMFHFCSRKGHEKYT